MSITFVGPEGTTFNSDSDLSGDVSIHAQDSLDVYVVPGKDLIALVANYVSNRKISRLEQADDDEVLGLT